MVKMLFGSGSGDGSGSGYGSGDGDGSGYGYGYGYGSGDGYGSGSGYGYGSETYWLASVDSYVARLGDKALVAVSAARTAGAFVGFWRSDKNGSPSNGGTAKPISPGDVQEISGPLSICSRGFHATSLPHKWKGERTWIVALYGEVQQQDDKRAALKREIIAEVKI